LNESTNEIYDLSTLILENNSASSLTNQESHISKSKKTDEVDE
jgi:hypothetical protein